MDHGRFRTLLLPLCFLLLALPPAPRPAMGQQPAGQPAPAPPPPASQEAAEALSRAQELLEGGNPREAVKAYKDADKLAGGACVECQLGLAKTYNRLGAFKEVQKSVDAALALTTDKALLARAYNEQGLALLAAAAEDTAKLQEAEKSFRKVLELSGGSNAARLNLGVVLLRLGRDDEGVALLKQYLEVDPDAASADAARDLIANPVRARKKLIHDFEMATLAGDYLTTEELRGKVVLIDFWGTWCAPCVAAVPGLRAMSKRMEKSPFVLVSVSTDTDEATLREFVTKNRMTWPQVWDKDHEITRKWGINSYPTYVLVSPEGEIVYSARGWSERLETEIQQRISGALRQAKKGAKPVG
jgi:thioredoxin-like negative regulator of GroEL